jgi:hypothetical protein
MTGNDLDLPAFRQADQGGSANTSNHVTLFVTVEPDVVFNGYKCIRPEGTPQSGLTGLTHNEHTLQCRTAPRNDGIKPVSVDIRIPGRG